MPIGVALSGGNCVLCFFCGVKTLIQNVSLNCRGVATLVNRRVDRSENAGVRAHAGEGGWERVVVLECNLDDTTGELLGSNIEALMRSGALDAWAVNGVGKKGRPCYVLHALCREEQVEEMATLILRETTTLGVRMRGDQRKTLAREMRTLRLNVAGREYNVEVKVGSIDGKIVNIKPEFDNVSRIAQESGLSAKIISQSVVAVAMAEFGLT